MRDFSLLNKKFYVSSKTRPSCLVVIVTTFIFTQFCFQSSATDSFRVTCYYASSAYYRPSPMHFWVEDIPVDLCDVLIYSFVGLNDTSNTIQVLEPYVDIQLGCFEKAVALKEKPGSRLRLVLLGLGGWGEGVAKYSDMVSDAEKRKAFVKSAVQFLQQYGFDGLDLDWEYPGDVARGGRSSDKKNFIFLIKELRAAFEPNGWLLTAAVPANSHVVRRGYDVPALGWLLDELHVMTYDMRDIWSGKADSHSQLYSKESDEHDLAKMNANDTIHMWHSLGAPMNKMLMGIPFYGRSFTLKDPQDHWPQAKSLGPGHMAEYTKEPGYIAYYEICSRVQSNSWGRGFDSEGKVPFIFKDNQWIGFDDPQSIAFKVNYVKEKGLGGVMLWAVDLDDFRGVCGMDYPLLRILRLRLDKFGNPWARL